MSRFSPIAIHPIAIHKFVALALFPFLAAGCESKPAPSAPAASAPAAAPAAKAEGAARVVGFELVSTDPVGALQFDVKYAGEGRFVGDADAVACEAKVPEALSSYNHIVAEKNLRLAFVAVKGFAGPVRIGQCRFQGGAKPEDFTITVRDASSPELQPIDPPPAIQVVLD